MSIIKGFKDGFKEFGHNINYIINSVLLSVVYVIGVGLTSIIARITGKRFLKLKPKIEEKTYWEDFEYNENYYRQF